MGIAVGSIVRLLSGGPDMTVYEISAYGKILCEWFDIKGKHRSHAFSREVLVQV